MQGISFIRPFQRPTWPTNLTYSSAEKKIQDSRTPLSTQAMARTCLLLANKLADDEQTCDVVKNSKTKMHQHNSLLAETDRASSVD